jgi:hypothetical protein
VAPVVPDAFAPTNSSTPKQAGGGESKKQELPAQGRKHEAKRQDGKTCPDCT